MERCIRFLYPLFFILSIFFIIPLTAQDNLDKLSIAQLDSLGDLSYYIGDYDLCLAYSEKSLEKAKVSGIDSVHSKSLNSLGLLYYDLGNYKKSEKLYLEAKKICLKTIGTEHRQYAAALHNLAGLYVKTGRYKEAEKLYLESGELRKRVLGAKHQHYSNSLNNLGLLYFQMQRYEEAEPLFRKAKDIRLEILGPEAATYATSLDNLSVLYQKLDKFEEAESMGIEAKNVRLKAFGENSVRYARSLNNLSTLYQTLEKPKKAEPLLLKVKEILSNVLGKDHANYAVSLDNLSKVYLSLGNTKLAEEYLLEAKTIRQKAFGTTHPRYAMTLNNLGLLYAKGQRYEEAESLFLQADKIWKEALGEKSAVRAMSLVNLADVYQKTGNTDAAISMSLASLAANSRDIDSSFAELSDYIFRLPDLDFIENDKFRAALLLLHRLLRQKGRGEEAYRLIKAAMQINEKIRNEFSAQGNKLRTLQQNTHFVALAIADALRLEKVAEAFAFAEQNKSVLLADALKAQRARTLGNLPDSLILQELDLQKRLGQLKKGLAESQKAEKKAALQAELNNLIVEIEAFKNQLESDFPKYYKLKYAEVTVQLKEVQELLDSKTALLEYFVSDSVTYLFCISSATSQVYPLQITKKELHQKVGQLRRALADYVYINRDKTDSYRMYIGLAHWFYEQLVAPAVSKLEGIEDLIIVPDYELGHLPFEAFLTEAGPAEMDYKNLNYLIKKYRMSYSYSATLLKENQEHPKSGRNGRMLAFAADYSELDGKLLQDLRGTYLKNMREPLIPLPAAEEEVKELEKSFKGEFKFGKAANETFFKANSSDYGLIHLAMHGLLHKRVPILSSLAFTEDLDSLEDNFLQAYEISQLELNAELVVLSACETGYGKFEQGEGVLSMARSFMYAGVPALVVSLWSVNDQATAKIMCSFYDNLAAGESKSKAIQEAKLDYIAKAKGFDAHPAYWSPFVQIGDSSPIFVEQKQGWTWWFVGAGLCFFVGLFWWMKKRSGLEK